MRSIDLRRVVTVGLTVASGLMLVACSPSDPTARDAASPSAVTPADARTPSTQARRVPVALKRGTTSGSDTQDVLPYADPFDEALERGRLSATGRSHVNTVFLRSDRQSPRYLVLPVQTQGYGFAPAFRAVVGAQLDLELALRGIHASRQIDVASHYGPYARRLGHEAIAQLAQQHGSSDLLAVHLGHDGADEAWLTLEVRPRVADKAPVRHIHRRVVLPADPAAAARVIGERLPAMLDELRLAGGSARPKATSTSGCRVDAWQLKDPARIAAPNERACHALVVGTLLPPSPDEHPGFASTATPIKLAWLAEAWVQSRAAGMRTIEQWAWRQLRLDAASVPAPSGAGTDDPVAGPLGMLLLAETGGTAIDAAAAAVEAPAGTRGFARVLFNERARFHESRRAVDLCAIDFTYPATTERTPCPSTGVIGAPTERLISRAELDLYQSWRLASFEKNLMRAARGDTDRKTLMRLTDAMPEDIRRHPSIRRQIYLALLKRPAEDSGWFGGNRREQSRNEAQEFVQTTAELQRWDPALDSHALSLRPVDERPADEGLRALAATEERLVDVLKADRFAIRSEPLRSEMR